MRDLIRRHIEEAAASLARMDEPRIAQVYAAAELLVACLRDGGAVHICGNGGSAADAQHIAAELAGRFLRDRRALACSALTTNTSALTAIGNDYSYDAVFARQVEAVVRPGDVVWIISTSGGSPSVLAAAKAARARQAKVLGFTGGEGGAMPPLCDVCFIAPAETTYAIQQLHQIAYHAICDIVERTVCP